MHPVIRLDTVSPLNEFWQVRIFVLLLVKIALLRVVHCQVLILWGLILNFADERPNGSRRQNVLGGRYVAVSGLHLLNQEVGRDLILHYWVCCCRYRIRNTTAAASTTTTHKLL